MKLQSATLAFLAVHWTACDSVVDGFTAATHTLGFRRTSSAAGLLRMSSTAAASDVEATEGTQTAIAASKLPKAFDYTPEVNAAGCDIAAWRRSYGNTKETPQPTKLKFVEDDGLATTLPSDFPTGTWFRNGAGRFIADDGQKAVHPFDGDGMMMSVTFDNDDDDSTSSDTVTFQNKFIATKKYAEDKKTGKMSARGTFGSLKSGGFLANLGDLSIANVANTNCVLAPQTNTLYALWEGGRPYALDAATLDTKDGTTEEFTFDGMLQKGDTMSAHYRYDPETRTYVNFGSGLIDPNSPNTKVYLYEHDVDTYELKHGMGSNKQRRICMSIPGVALMHDFVLTKNYLVFSWIKSEVYPLGGLKALLGLGPFAGALKIPEDSEARLLVLPRSLFDLCEDDAVEVDEAGDIVIDPVSDDRVMNIPIPFFFNFHFGNAYEDPDEEKLVLDMVRSKAEDFDFGISTIKGPNEHLWETIPIDEIECADMARYTFNLETQQLEDEPVVLCTQNPEFPSIPKDLSTRPHRYTYTVASRKDASTSATGMKPLWGASSALTKIDAETPGKYEIYAFDADEFLGEPMVVRKKNASNAEDSCYIMTTVSKVSTQTTDIVILDAEGPGKLEEGPVCRIRLPEMMVNGCLHGDFYEGIKIHS